MPNRPSSVAARNRSVLAADALAPDQRRRLANFFFAIIGSAFPFSEFAGASYLVEPAVIKLIF
jgi:hypothetical protein